jgi:hypothetical protein
MLRFAKSAANLQLKSRIGCNARVSTMRAGLVNPAAWRRLEETAALRVRDKRDQQQAIDTLRFWI